MAAMFTQAGTGVAYVLRHRAAEGAKEVEVGFSRWRELQLPGNTLLYPHRPQKC